METPYLPRGLDALDDSQADQDPSHQQGEDHLPVQATRVVDAAGDVESLAVPEVSGGRALLTLRHHDYNDQKEGMGMNSAARYHISDHLKIVIILNSQVDQISQKGS